MLFWVILKVALKSLWANKLRSILAMLGIIIGVAAVIANLAIGAGAQARIIAQFTSMGTNLLVVTPAQRGSGGVMSGQQQNLTLDDAAAILRIDGVRRIAPVVRGSGQLKYMSKNTRSSLMGSSITYLPIRNFEVEKGECFTENDVDHSARMCVIGPTTAENLFGVNDPVGEFIKVNGVNFEVTGVLKAKGDQGWFNPDDQIIIPYTTAMKQVLGVDYLREIDIQVKEEADINKIQADVTTLLRKRHRQVEGADNDFNIRNQVEFLNAMNESQQTFTILLASTAAISLLVGGIGIMNIMLVTVTERTREIGVRKAIGAKERDILSQFVIEATLMSSLGGFLGVGIGILAAWTVAYFTRFVTLIQPNSIILALSVAAGVGIFFGFYPARRAAKLDPIDALRYE
jgi:putative ABC transport system permease protein